MLINGNRPDCVSAGSFTNEWGVGISIMGTLVVLGRGEVLSQLLLKHELFCLNVPLNVYTFESSREVRDIDLMFVYFVSKEFLQSSELLDGCNVSSHTPIEAVLINKV